jgi:hypothetical protein
VRMTTNYRRFASGGAVSPEATVSIDTDKSIDDVSADAREAFAGQLDAVKKEEQAAKDKAAGPPVLSPERREDVLRQWQQEGLSNEAATFLKANRHMLDIPGVLNAAVKHAHLHGYETDTPEYFDSIRDYYSNRGLNPEVQDDNPLPLLPGTRTPRKTRVPKDDEEDWSPSGRGSIVSAPVSRDLPGSNYGEREGIVRLSVQQKEHAKAAGVSLEEYAKGVLRLRKEKEDGMHQ